MNTNCPTLRVLLPASHIPNGSQVTKKTGTKPYTLRGSIVVHGDKKKEIQKQELKGDGVAFLISQDGQINAIPETTELLVELDFWEIRDIMDWED